MASMIDDHVKKWVMLRDYAHVHVRSPDRIHCFLKRGAYTQTFVFTAMDLTSKLLGSRAGYSSAAVLSNRDDDLSVKKLGQLK